MEGKISLDVIQTHLLDSVIQCVFEGRGIPLVHRYRILKLNLYREMTQLTT